MLIPEVTPAGLIPIESVMAHQFGKFQKVGESPCMLQALVELLSTAGHSDFSPKSVSQFRDFLEGILEALGIARDPAFINHQLPELPVKDFDGLTARNGQEAFGALLNFVFGIPKSRVIRPDFTGWVPAQVVANRDGNDE